MRAAPAASAGETEPLDSVQTIVAHHLARTEADLVAATGGASLCRVGNGAHVGSVKYAEGGHAAMRELERLLRSPDTVARAAALERLETWQAARAQAEPRGPAWTAYREGGVAALRGVVEDLTGTTEDTHR